MSFMPTYESVLEIIGDDIHVIQEDMLILYTFAN